MIEVERKRAINNRQALTQRLISLEFEAGKPTSETDIYYTRPDVDFIKTVECLRIRTRGDDFAEITYKPATIEDPNMPRGIVSKEESNVRIANPDQVKDADSLLKSIGMIELARVVKSRISYSTPKFPDVTVSLDNINGIGDFIETEVLTNDASIGMSVVERVEKEIGVVGMKIVTIPYRDIVMYGLRND